MAAIDKFRRMFDRTTSHKGDQWLEKIPAWLGRKDGTMDTGTYGLVYVRTADGQVLQVFNNNKVDLKFNMLVRIGRHKDEPNIWQIVGRREAWDVPAASGVQYHHEQHEFLGPDMVFLDRRQISQLSVLVYDGETFVVQVYGAFVRTANGVVEISSQLVDLSSYVPASGAIFVNIEADDDGALTVHEGANFGAAVLAATSYIPTPDEGKYILAVVILYEGQTELVNNDIRVPMPLGVLPKTSGLQIHEATADTPLSADEFGFWDVVDAAIKKITWSNFKALFFSDAEGDPADVTTGSAADGTSTYAARRDHVHHIEMEPVGQYRQFVYEVAGGDFSFVIDEDGNPVMALEDLE